MDPKPTYLIKSQNEHVAVQNCKRLQKHVSKTLLMLTAFRESRSLSFGAVLKQGDPPYRR